MKHVPFWRRMYGATFYQKLLLSQLLVVLVCLCIMGGYNFVLSRSTKNSHVIDLVSHSSDLLATSLRSRFQQMESTSTTLQFTLYSMLNRNALRSNQAFTAANTRNSLFSMHEAFGYLDISVYLPSDFIAAAEGVTFYDINLSEGRHQDRQVRQTPLHQLGWAFFRDFRYPFMRFKTNAAYDVLSCFTTVQADTYGNQNFTFFIDIDEREISELLLTGMSTTPLTQYLIDRNGAIISHIDPQMLGTSVAPEFWAALSRAEHGESFLYDGNLVFAQTLDPAPWTLVVLLPTSYLSTVSSGSLGSILLACSVASIIALLMASLMAHQLTRKLRSMNAVIRSIAPRFVSSNESFMPIEQRMALPGSGDNLDDLDELASVFNAMIDRLNREMKRALGSAHEQEELRYQLLQAKINPHFLYNILDSIKICNSLGRYGDANQMLSMLAQFYRLILRKHRDLITIAEELEIVRLYLEMESISHDFCFTWSIDAEKDIELFMIPRFVLQPIVENCITHGIPGDKGKMHIDIRLRYLEDAIQIDIRDNGLGIPMPQLKALMDVIRGKGGGDNRFYGLSNVYARLLLHAADADPIRFASEPGHGTTVTLVLQQTIVWDDAEEEKK